LPLKELAKFGLAKLIEGSGPEAGPDSNRGSVADPEVNPGNDPDRRHPLSSGFTNPKELYLPMSIGPMTFCPYC